MDKQQAAEILKAHNAWRRDDSENPKRMPNTPKVLGEAIDVAVQVLSQPEATQLERFKAAILVLFPWEPDAKFLTVDKNGTVAQWQWRPYPMAGNGWGSDAGWVPVKWINQCCSIPDGIDWRDTLIERT